jgi:O-succinylbenzoate synthase
MNAHQHFKLEWRTYRRSFVKPLHTAHGLWLEREGLIVRLTDKAGSTGYGEFAPIEAFGSESLATGRRWLEMSQGAYNLALKSRDNWDALPSLAYALASAEAMLGSDRRPHANAIDTNRGSEGWPVCGLLPAGAKALDFLPGKLSAGYRTFKWKIGVEEVGEEMRIARLLMAQMPSGCRLRLDANGALTEQEAAAWCQLLVGEGYDHCVFIEQPLPPGSEKQMAALQADYGIVIALDESLMQANQGVAKTVREWLQSWPGFCVLKPSLMGAELCRILLGQQSGSDSLGLESQRMVFSSAFETDVGVDAMLALVAACGGDLPALGLDTVAAFADGLNTDLPNARITFKPSQRLTRAQRVWESLAKV